MRLLFLFVCFFLMTLSALAQDSQKVAKQDDKKKVEQKTTADIEEIQLDELHLNATIEKPSVSILPTRSNPKLENIEYIIRNFDHELKMISDEMFGFKFEKRKFTKIQDAKDLLVKNRK